MKNFWKGCLSFFGFMTGTLFIGIVVDLYLQEGKFTLNGLLLVCISVVLLYYTTPRFYKFFLYPFFIGSWQEDREYFAFFRKEIEEHRKEKGESWIKTLHKTKSGKLLIYLGIPSILLNIAGIAMFALGALITMLSGEFIFALRGLAISVIGYMLFAVVRYFADKMHEEEQETL